MRIGRLPPSTGDLRTDAIAELRWARRGEGLTVDKLTQMPAVLDLPVVREALAGVPEARRPAAAYRAVREAARALGNSLHARMLRAALGIDDESGARNLSERRAQFKSFNEARTIYDVENRMVDALVTALGGLAEARRPAAAPEPEPDEDRVRAWNVPLLRDPHFVGRDDLVAALRAALGTGGAAALTHTVTKAVSGLGGIGKTALAAEFAYRHTADYDVVWWLRAEEPTTLAADYAGLALALDLPARGSQADAIAAVRGWLGAHDRWLLVFDNAEQPDDVVPYLPGLHGHVLVTTRNPRWSEVATVVEVPPLSVAAAAKLVRRRTGLDDPEAAAALATKLECVPKVIEVAAGMFASGSALSLARFTERLGDGTAATEGVWDAAFDRAAEVAGAREVLAVCAVLNPDDVQPELLLDATGLREPALENAVAALRAQQVLRRGIEGLTMHRLVQAATRARLRDADRCDAANRVAALLLAVDPLPDPARLPYVRRIQAHVPYVVAALGDAPPAGRLLAWYATRLLRDGAYGPARAAIERALAISEAAHGRSHPDVGQQLHLLSWALCELGDLVPAREAAEQALEIGESVLDPYDPALADQYRIVGRIRAELGDLRGARDAAARALQISEAALGPDHAVIGGRLSNLSWTLCELGELAAAREAGERALAIGEATLGPDHPLVGVRLSNLAWILCESGDLAAARAAAERSVDVTVAALGADHPDVGSRLHGLARVLGEIDDLPAARAAEERAIAIGEAALGPDHHFVGSRLGVLGWILAEAGDLRGAREVTVRAIAVCEAALGPGHPEVGRQLGTLAPVLAGLGDLDGARDAAVRALATCEAALGPRHLDVGHLLRVLAEVERQRGDLAAARDAAERALAVSSAALGEEHPEVAAALHALAAVLADLGDLAAARDRARRAVATAEAVLGPAHRAAVRHRRLLRDLDRRSASLPEIRR